MQRIFALVLGIAVSWCPAGSALGQGPKEAARCTGCHGIADPGVAGDDLWLGRIRTTACVQPPAPKGLPLRQELIEWFRGKGQDRPRRVDEARPAGEGEGTVTPDFDRGSVLLWPASEGSAAKPVRLVWSGGADAELGRPVPAGEYVVRNYKVQRADAAGTVWQIWGSGTSGRKVGVVAGSRIALGLDLAVRVKPMVMDKGRELQLGLGVTGDSGQGLTVIRGKDRVPATCELRGRDGKALAKVDLRYG